MGKLWFGQLGYGNRLMGGLGGWGGGWLGFCCEERAEIGIATSRGVIL